MSDHAPPRPHATRQRPTSPMIDTNGNDAKGREPVNNAGSGGHCMIGVAPGGVPAREPVNLQSPLFQNIHTVLSIIALFINYFLAQYDKFILSYFQDSFSASLSLSATQYAVLSGYATGIVYALLALPIAYLADYLPRARVWTLTIAALWWSLCVVFQSLANNFWQVLLARIGMGIGQAAVAPLSVSLISDMRGGSADDGMRGKHGEERTIPLRRITAIFLGASFFYVGVYVGEAVSGQIATAFTATESGWRIALRAIGITGLVVAVVLRLILREPTRKTSLVNEEVVVHEKGVDPAASSGVAGAQARTTKLSAARVQLVATCSHILRMRSFWLLVLSASFRQLSGNVFGYYMPTYLSNTYPSHPELLSRYGIIVGTVGTFSVLLGGALTALLWNRTKLTPLYLTAISGMISSVFVLLMVFSRDIAGGSEDKGIKILYGTMAAAYLTAETWLGCLEVLIALLLPPRYKTFGLAIWESVQVLVYSGGPEIIGLALRTTDPGSQEYTRDTQVALAVIIPVGYWLAGLGFLLTIPLLKRDLRDDIAVGRLSANRRWSVSSFAGLLAAFVIALFVASIVYDAE